MNDDKDVEQGGKVSPRIRGAVVVGARWRLV